MIVVHSTCYYALVFAAMWVPFYDYVIAQIVLQERWLITRNMTSVLNTVSIHCPQPYTVFHLSFLLCQQKVLDDVFLLSPPQKMQQRLTPHRGPTLYCLFSVDWLLLLVQLVCGRWDWRRGNPFWVTQRSSKTGVQDVRWTLPQLRLLTSVVVVSCTENSKVPYDILIWYFLYCVEVYAVFMNHDPYSQPNNTNMNVVIILLSLYKTPCLLLV